MGYRCPTSLGVPGMSLDISNSYKEPNVALSSHTTHQKECFEQIFHPNSAIHQRRQLEISPFFLEFSKQSITKNAKKKMNKKIIPKGKKPTSSGVWDPNLVPLLSRFQRPLNFSVFPGKDHGFTKATQRFYRTMTAA